MFCVCTLHDQRVTTTRQGEVTASYSTMKTRVPVKLAWEDVCDGPLRVKKKANDAPCEFHRRSNKNHIPIIHRFDGWKDMTKASQPSVLRQQTHHLATARREAPHRERDQERVGDDVLGTNPTCLDVLAAALTTKIIPSSMASQRISSWTRQNNE